MTRAFVEIDPRYQLAIDQQDLADPDHVLGLPGLIVSGHPNRNVARIALGVGQEALPAFLKREHRIPWKDRLANAMAGFGFVARSLREFRVLRWLRSAGIGCPDPIAAGENGRGQAFLIVRELPKAVELRTFLGDRKSTSRYHRHRFARRLGEALARIHDAGFDHPDLYAKHVHVGPVSEAIYFLDWQRSRRRNDLPWHLRWSTLAALDATLAADLASPGERLVCLRAYLRASAQIFLPRSFRADAAAQIARRSQRLQRRRRIREQRYTPLASGAQGLIRLDGEALVVTRDFQAECGGHIPYWLVEPCSNGNADPRRTTLALPGGRRAILVRRDASRPGQWLWNALRGRRLESPELQEAAAMFRLQRFGALTPRLLAFGQRHSLPWRSNSFLLIEAPPRSVPLTTWLSRHAPQLLWTVERKQRRRLIAGAGDILRRIHDAGYRGRGFSDRFFLVQSGVGGNGPFLIIGSLDGLDCCRRRAGTARARRDVADVLQLLSPALANRSDELRFLLAYLGLARLNATAKVFVRSLARPEQSRERRGTDAFFQKRAKQATSAAHQRAAS